MFAHGLWKEETIRSVCVIQFAGRDITTNPLGFTMLLPAAKLHAQEQIAQEVFKVSVNGVRGILLASINTSSVVALFWYVFPLNSSLSTTNAD